MGFTKIKVNLYFQLTSSFPSFQIANLSIIDSYSCTALEEMKDGEDKETTKSGAVRNNLLTTANIPYSTENKPEHESLGVIVQQHWQHPERPIGITGSTSKSST